MVYTPGVNLPPLNTRGWDDELVAELAALYNQSVADNQALSDSLNATIAGLQSQIQNPIPGDKGDPGPKPKTPLTWEADTPATGDFGDPYYIPNASHIIGGPYATMRTAPGGLIKLNLQADTGSGYVDLYASGSEFVIDPAVSGGLRRVGVQPASNALPAGSWLKAKNVVSPSGVSSTPVSQTPNIGASLTANVNNHNIPIPTGTGTSGTTELLIHIVSGTNSVTPPSGWTLIDIPDNITTPTWHLSILWKTTTTTESTTQNVTYTSQVEAYGTLRFTGVDGTGPFDNNATITNPANGTTAATSAVATPGANRIGLLIAGTRWGSGSALTGVAENAGTEIAEQESTKATSNNNGLVAVTYDMTTQGNIPATTLTATGTSLTALKWILWTVSIKAPSASAGQGLAFTAFVQED
jgi:hypothetical protein